MRAQLKTFLVSAAILLAGVAGFLILKATKPVPPEKEATRVRPIVRVMDVKAGDFRATIEESGTVEPKITLELTAEVFRKNSICFQQLEDRILCEEGRAHH